jgi:hypothetical protein
MALKATVLTRAEYLAPEERRELGVETGLVVIEARNPDLKRVLKHAPDGYAAYLRSLGSYKPADKEWKEGRN